MRRIDSEENLKPQPEYQETGKLKCMKVDLYKDGLAKTFPVHRVVLPAFLPNTDRKPTIDHKNRDPADNRLSNLRYATYAEQRHNQDKQEGTSSFYIGVYFDENAHKYRSRITQRNGECKYLGYFQ